MTPDEIRKLNSDYFNKKDRGEYQDKCEEINIGPWSTQEEIDAKNAQIRAKYGSHSTDMPTFTGNLIWGIIYLAILVPFAWSIIEYIF